MVASARQARMRDNDVGQAELGGVSWFLVHFLRQLRVQRFHIFVHGSFTKPCVRSVDKPRELLCTPAFLAVFGVIRTFGLSVRITDIKRGPSNARRPERRDLFIFFFFAFFLDGGRGGGLSCQHREGRPVQVRC